MSIYGLDQFVDSMLLASSPSLGCGGGRGLGSGGFCGLPWGVCPPSLSVSAILNGVILFRRGLFEAMLVEAIGAEL